MFISLVTVVIVIWCSEGVAEVGGGHDDGDAEALPPLEDHGMEVESEEWVERHQVSQHWNINLLSESVELS